MMKLNKNKTKLIATIGPSLDKLLNLNLNEWQVNANCQKQYNLLVDSGVNVFRFNMSHDMIEKHKLRLDYLRYFNANNTTKCGIMIDTMGPEIRVKKIQKIDPNKNIIRLNDEVKIICNDPDFMGNAQAFAVTDFTKKYSLANDVNANDEIMIGDGKLILKVKNVDKDSQVITTVCCTKEYEITENKRVNLFNKKYSLPFLNEYDKLTIQKAVEWNVEYLALSFVSNVQQINDVKKIINSVDKNAKIKIIAKIETFEALENLKEIIENVDGVMVARGDLSLEIGWEKTPYYQDKIVELCHQKNKICIVATQMLDSLEKNIVPTRAEVTDCYYATKSMVDATMLSGETASGNDPLNAIMAMKKIGEFAYEKICNKKTTRKLKIKEKFFLMRIKQCIGKKQEIVLKNFSETEIRLISSVIWNKRFYVIDTNNSSSNCLYLYRNVTVKTEFDNKHNILNNKKIFFKYLFGRI